jgi:hypothetical protein
MSVVEIMQEIPHLSLLERRMLTLKLLELEPGGEASEMCDQLADSALQLLDRMEEDDASRVQG